MSAAAPAPQGTSSPGTPELVRAELLAACQAGDRTALDRLFTLCAPRVYRWAVLLGLSASDAEDASQEVLATAARRIATCRNAAVLSSWLFQMTRRMVANTRRSAWVRRVLRGSKEDEEPAFEVDAVNTERELAVRRCFRRLSRVHAEVLLLAGVEGYTAPEVAAMLGIPEGTVASRLRLARASFSRLWEEK